MPIARTHGRQVIGGERLSDDEGISAGRQRVGVIEEVRIAVEVVEIAFEADDDRAGLPIAAHLAAAEEIRGISRSGPVIADLRRIEATQIAAGADRRGDVGSAGAATAVKTDVAPGPLIRRRRERRCLYRQVGCGSGHGTAGERQCCREEVGGQHVWMGARPDFGERNGHGIPRTRVSICALAHCRCRTCDDARCSASQ